MTLESDGKAYARGRFAPSTTGRAHPGTLLAALLCWLDARAAGAEIWLRFEDLDLERTKPGYVDWMRRDLEWLGLDWDHEVRQSHSSERHEAGLESLVREGRVYACSCTRGSLRRDASRAPDGSFVYPGTCRANRVGLDQWREESRPLRLELLSERIELLDESGADLGGDASQLFGDPILRRRDGAFAYHFASVLDDDASGIDRIVRGNDLMPATTLQVAMQRALGLATPRYRHHLLLLERRGDKLSKLHGAVDVRALRALYDAPALVGLLAGFVGLVSPFVHCAPHDLVAGFDWSRVSPEDITLRWSPVDGLERS